MLSPVWYNDTGEKLAMSLSGTSWSIYRHLCPQRLITAQVWEGPSPGW